MTVLRGLLVLILTVVAAAGTQAQEKTWHGLSFETLTAETAEEKGLFVVDGALITGVTRNSPARHDLKAGDAVTVANRRPINTADDLKRVLSDVAVGDSLTIVRMREAKADRVTLKRPKPIPVTPLKLTSAPTLMLETGGHMAAIKGIALTPDGQQLVSAGNDKVIRVWDLATGKTVRTIRGDVAPGALGEFFAMVMSPDGRWLAAGGFMAPGYGVRDGDVGNIRIYDFKTGELVALLNGHSNVVNTLAFSPDGRRLVSGSGDDSAIVWEAPAMPGGWADWRLGKLKQRLVGHEHDVYSVGFLPNGNRVVTASNDMTLGVWDVASGKRLNLLVGHSDKVSALAIRGDGTVASGDDSGEVRIWPPHLVNRRASKTQADRPPLPDARCQMPGDISDSCSSRPMEKRCLLPVGIRAATTARRYGMSSGARNA